MANGSRATATAKMMTVGLDLGDRYSYLCLLDPNSGEVLEEGRLRTTPEALKRSFCAREPMRVAIEAGTHSPWVSRLLEECGHEVFALQTLARFTSSTKPTIRPTNSVPRISLVWPGWIRSSSHR